MEETNVPVTINDQINAVVEARERVRVANEARVTAYAEWLEKNQPLFSAEKEATTACQEAEATLRTLALDTYEHTGIKQVATGIVVRVMTKLNYDIKVAFDWAKSHKMALKLDTSAFEKIAKADPPDFVKITEEPQATLSQELQKVEAKKD